MTFRDVFRPGDDPGGESSHVHDAGDISGSMPFVRVVGGVHVPNLEARVNVLETTGLRLYVVEYFTSSGTFKKADYPGLRAVMVHCQGGGGGGGGCAAAGAGQGASAGGGGGGGYVRKLILVDSLEDEETVTVGAGGAGGAAGNNNGSPGGDSSFGAYAVASGGGGGNGSGVTSGNSQNAPGAGGNAPTGDIRIRGDFGGYGLIVGGFGLLTGFGGGSFLGGSVRPGDTGEDGIAYGGGGSGARNATGAGVARPGGNGAPGIVIVEVWA